MESLDNQRDLSAFCPLPELGFWTMSNFLWAHKKAGDIQLENNMMKCRLFFL